MATVLMNPDPFLRELVGQTVVVKLKWGSGSGGSVEYKGFLKAVDRYMNIQLAAAEEWIGGKYASTIGEVLIRCNNVLYVRQAPDSVTETEEAAAAKAAAEQKANSAMND